MGSFLAVTFLFILAALIIGRVLSVRDLPPIVCMCELNGRVGVVSIRDYDKGLRDYEKSHLADWQQDYRLPHQSTIVRVRPTFVFDADSSEYEELVQGCLVLKAVFQVPHVPRHHVNSLEEAYIHIHNKLYQRVSAAC